MALFGSDMNYGTALKEWPPEEWQSFGARGGMIDGSMNLAEPSTGIGNYLGKQSLGDITGTVGLGLGTFDSLFGMGSKVAKEGLKSKKMSNELLGLNIDATKQAMADRKQFNKGMADASAKAMGLGKVGLYDNTKVV